MRGVLQAMLEGRCQTVIFSVADHMHDEQPAFGVHAGLRNRVVAATKLHDVGGSVSGLVRPAYMCMGRGCKTSTLLTLAALLRLACMCVRRGWQLLAQGANASCPIGCIRQ